MDEGDSLKELLAVLDVVSGRADEVALPSTIGAEVELSLTGMTTIGRLPFEEPLLVVTGMPPMTSVPLYEGIDVETGSEAEDVGALLSPLREAVGVLLREAVGVACP